MAGLNTVYTLLLTNNLLYVIKLTFSGGMCDEDMDNDGIENHLDNCPVGYNPDQLDVNRKLYYHFSYMYSFFFQAFVQSL